VVVEDLLARQRDLHRAVRDSGELGRDELVRAGIALAAEAAADRDGNDADPARRHLEHLGERAMEVVRVLRRGGEGELAPVPGGQHGVLLERHVRRAFVEEEVLAHVVGLREAGVHVAEVEPGHAIDLWPLALAVDERPVGGERLGDRHHRRQLLVLDLDQRQRALGGLVVDRGYGGDRLAHVAHLLQRQRVLVLADGEDAVGDGQMLASEDGVDARQLDGLADVEAPDVRVRLGAPQQLADQHARQPQVVGVPMPPSHLRVGVDLGQRLADDRELLGGEQRLRARCLDDGHRRSPSAASSTASRIFT